MKILFVYKYLTLGGVEAVIRARLDGMHPHGIEAHAWFLADGPGRGMFTGKESFLHIGDVSALMGHLEVETYDVLSSIDTEEAFPAMHRVTPRSKLVLEIHSPYRENVVYLRWLERLEIAGFLVPSSFQASVVRGSLGRHAPIHVVPNPLRRVFVAEPEDFEPRPPYPVVAWIGRLDRVKYWVEYLRIAAALLERGRLVEFWLVGRADEPVVERWFVRKAKQLGVLSRLKWFRGFPHEQMPRLLDATRDSGGVVVSTSRSESFGMTVAEAMARRCPVVVPAHGPFPEYVRDGENGLCYRPGSVREAAHSVEVLLSDAALRRRLGENARRDILALCGPEHALAILARELAIAAQPPAGPLGLSG